MMQFYNHFTVLRSKITVTVKNSALLSTPTVCIRVDADSTPLTVIDRIIELGGCVQNTLGIQGSTSSNVKMSLLVDISKLQGVKRGNITANPSLQGSATASPVECTYFHVQLWNSLGITSAAQCDVVLEQEAKFVEPRNNVQSVHCMHPVVSLPEGKDPAPILRLDSALAEYFAARRFAEYPDLAVSHVTREV
jgi:hypothetical protein